MKSFFTMWKSALFMFRFSSSPAILQPIENALVQQSRRSMYTDWRMVRDAKRRRLVTQYAKERIQINALRKNDILPKSLQEIADKEIAALPRDSALVRCHNRCVITSRPRSVLTKWRLSRIQFRLLADYNLLSGVQRALW